MTNKEKNMLNESIAHWTHMITWAETQDKTKKAECVDTCEMESEINESWDGDYCPFCAANKYNCPRCFLFKNGMGCMVENSLWEKVSDSATWGDWIKNAKKFVKAMKNLMVSVPKMSLQIKT